MLFFVDESGPGESDAPYEILAGAAIPQEDLWNLIQSIQAAEIEFFNAPLSEIGGEFKGSKLLKKKKFRFADQGEEILSPRRRELAGRFLAKGKLLAAGQPSEPQRKDEYTAYGQAVLAFIHKLFDLCGQHRVKFFATIVDSNAPRPADTDFLRKDYAYLFERFFYYLEDVSLDEIGIVVFDELEKSKSRILLDQMKRYFLQTAKGRARSSRIVPEPFFVHSDLTTAIQIADIAAYCLNSGFRLLARMKRPHRKEMKQYAQRVFDLRYEGKRFGEQDNREWPIYGFVYLDDLRPRKQKEGAEFE